MKIPLLNPALAALTVVAALALVACETSKPVVPNPRVLARSGSPLTLSESTELFGEHPLTAFQRTGSMPLPIANYPVNTPVTVQAQSGAFYMVRMPDNRQGWMASRNVGGVYAQIPGLSAQDTRPTTGDEPLNPIDPNAGNLADPGIGAGGQPETIDLDRIP